MSCVFQNIAPPLTARRVAGGGHTRRVERGVGGQYFGRRKSYARHSALLYLYRILFARNHLDRV